LTSELSIPQLAYLMRDFLEYVPWYSQVLANHTSSQNLPVGISKSCLFCVHTGRFKKEENRQKTLTVDAGQILIVLKCEYMKFESSHQ
jgi:hypothetical protein